MTRGSGFLSHLEVLRRKLLAAIAVFFAFFVFFFAFGEQVLSFLTVPLSGLPVNLIYIQPQEKLVAYMKASAVAGFLCSFPFLLLQAASFIHPALKKEERAVFYIVVVFMLAFFAAGAAFAYAILLPFASAFFFSFAAGDGIAAAWSVGAYVDFATSLILVISAVFQTPLALLFLVWTGILDIAALRRRRRHALVAIFIAAALLTPPDVYSQVVVGSILYLLFELTLVAGSLMTARRKQSGAHLAEGRGEKE